MLISGADLGRGCSFSNTTGILQQKKTMWFIGVEVEQETSAPPPKKNPGSAPEFVSQLRGGAFLTKIGTLYTEEKITCC